MRKVLVAALLVVGITAFAQEAQVKKSGRERLSSEQRVDFKVKKLTKDLNLNEKQAEQVKALVTKEVQKRDAKRAEMKEDKEKNKEEMRANMEKEKAIVTSEMQKILTPEQFSKWQQNREEKKEKMKEKMSERKQKKDLK